MFGTAGLFSDAEDACFSTHAMAAAIAYAERHERSLTRRIRNRYPAAGTKAG
jgi:hypothetical protein